MTAWKRLLGAGALFLGLTAQFTPGGDFVPATGCGGTSPCPAAQGGTGVANSSTITVGGALVTGGALTFADLSTANALLATGSARSVGTTATGANVLTALGVAVGTDGAFVVKSGALGTPSSGVATNLTGTASGLTAGNASAVAVGSITGLGTGVATALAVNTGTAGSPVINGGTLGTPSSGVGTNLTGTAAGLTAGTASSVAVAGITGLGTGVATALAVNTGTAGSHIVNGGALGTPSSGVATNLTGTAASLTAGNVTTNANLTGPITSSGNATSIASQTGTGTKFVVDAGPTVSALTVTGSLTATGLVTLANLATQATNTVVGNATSGTASPTALAVGTCSTAASALIWTTNTGFGCNTSITAAAVPASGLSGSTLAAGVTASSLTSHGTLAAQLLVSGGVNNTSGLGHFGYDSSAGAQVLGNGAGQDVSLYNSAGGQVLYIPHATSQVQFAGQILAQAMTQTSAVQSGTVCNNTGSSLTYDATLGCLASDERLKTGITKFAGAGDILRTLQPITYQWKEGSSSRFADDPGQHIGLGAFTTAYTDERLISRGGDGQPRGWRQDAMIALLVAAVQEQQAQITELRAKAK